MKIAASQYTAVAALDNKAAEKQIAAKPIEPTKKAQQLAAIDPVLGDAQATLSSMPEVDMDRVAEMKNAISTGQLDINIDDLAVAMQKYYQG